MIEERKKSFDLTKSISNEKCVFKGNSYRITVLSESLVRLEYNPNGIFYDNPTETVYYRNFEKPKFEYEDNGKAIRIVTKYFTLVYVKEKPFKGSSLNPSSNLMIKLNSTEKVWYYGHHEVRNYPYGAFIDQKKYRRMVRKSLYSIDGFCSLDDSKSVIFDEYGNPMLKDSKSIDMYVFMYGNDFKTCLKDYIAITGNPLLIPRYALGTWWSKNEDYDENSLMNIVYNFSKNKIPLSVVMLNKSWHNLIIENQKTLSTGFSFNSQLFSNPTETLNQLHKYNIKCGLTINPFEGIYPNESSYWQLKENIDTDEAGIIPFSVYNTKLINKYFEYLIKPLNDMGVDFYFVDYFNKDKLQDISLLKYYHMNTYNNTNMRPFIYGYNTSLVPHRYSVLYAGNSRVTWESLKEIPTFNSTGSNMGVCFWSHSIGGYEHGMEDNELFTRYVQLGVFSPILNLSSNSGKYYKREPWKWGIKTSKITTDYINFRYKLIPYIYTEIYNYHKTGISLIHPLYYQYPGIYDDPIYNQEYFFGRQMLISPITNKKDVVMNRVIQKFFIPEGIWYDLFTGKMFKGNKKYVSFYKDEDYPVFVKQGSIIPMSLNPVINETGVPESMEILIFPGKNNAYNLYEDDGITNNYLNSDYLMTNIEYLYDPNSYKLTIRPIAGKKGIIHDYRNYRLVFRNTKYCDNVTVFLGNKKITCNKYYNNNSLIIELNHISTSEQLTVMIKGENLEIDALRIINEDVESILQDLPIDTDIKTKIDNILFSDLEIKNKRIAIRKLGHEKNFLEKKYVELFLKLLEYINEV